MSLNAAFGARLRNECLREYAGGTPEAPLSVDAMRRDIARQFRDAGIESPDLDARILTGHALGLDFTALIRAGDRLLSADENAIIEALAARRLRREPVARIV